MRLQEIAQQLATEPGQGAARRPCRRVASLRSQDQCRVIDERPKQWQTDPSGDELWFQQALAILADHQSERIGRTFQLPDYFASSGDTTDVVSHQKYCQLRSS